MGGHEVTRNLSEPSDQTLLQIDVYAEYLRTMSPQTTSRALRAILKRGGGKSVRIDSRYTEAYGRRRFTNQENIVHREISGDGRNENERKRGSDSWD